MKKLSIIALLGLGAALLAAAPGTAEAQRRKSSLEGQPAVRHRLLLVKNRFEITPLRPSDQFDQAIE